MQKRLWLLVPVSFAALLLLVAGLLARAPEATGPARRLPDGSWIRLAAVSYGPEHQFLPGSRWQKALYPLLPTAITEPLGWKPITFAPRRTTLVFWTVSRGGTQLHRLRGAAVDEHGCETEAVDLYRIDYSRALPSEVTLAWTAPEFPRRGKWIGLRFYDRFFKSGRVPVAEFSVPNPVYASYPAWTPEPLPITKRQEGRTFTLVELTTGVGEAGTPASAAREPAWTRATFRVSRGGRPETGWDAAGLEIADATGNRWTPRFYFCERAGETLRLYFRGALCPDESAWKLRVEFVPTSDLAPEELWTVRGVGMPAPRTVARFSGKTTRNGLTVGFAHIDGAGGPTEFQVRRIRRHPCVHLNVYRKTSGPHVTLVRAADSRGREIPRTLSVSSWGFRRSFGLRVPPDVRMLDLDFAVTPSRVVEFLAAPSRPAATLP